MGCTQVYIPCVLQLLMDIQSVGPKTRAGVKQNTTETKPNVKYTVWMPGQDH